MRKYLVLLSISLIVILAGCGKLPSGDELTSKYKNDVITLEEYTVSTKEPYAGSSTTISFLIKNNGNEIISDLNLNFFDIPGFEVRKLDCEKVDELDEILNTTKCIFRNIEPLDTRKVSITLQAPDKEVLGQTTAQFSISFSINYNHSVEREALIPIVDGSTIKKPPQEFKESDPPYSPIQINFEPPLGGTTIIDGQEVKQHWAVKDTPFEINFIIKHVGSTSIGDIKLPKIEKSKMLNSIKTSKLEKPEFLDKACQITQGNVVEGEKEYMKIPGTITCNFVNSEDIKGWMYGKINVKFDYQYEFIKKETFTVRPVQ